MTTDGEREWADEDAGPLVRPYAMTRGRTLACDREFDPVTLVVATRPASPTSGLTADHERVVALCGQPISMADVAGALGVPLMVAKVLLGDLMGEGAVTVHPPTAPPDPGTLQAVLDGIRRL